MSTTTLWLFITTFFVVSITPGMCMMLAMTLGMTVGFRNSLKMMVGELVGVCLQVLLVLLGLASILLAHPDLFLGLKVLGAGYLTYLGVQLWQSKGRLAIPDDKDEVQDVDFWSLTTQGFITAIANPKGWAFFIALLPPFIDPKADIFDQSLLLVAMILFIEWLCLILYASGGKWLKHLLRNSNNMKRLNRVAGTLMAGIAIWLVVS